MKRVAIGAGVALTALAGAMALRQGTTIAPSPTPAAQQQLAPATGCISVNGLPDVKCTPGATRTTDKNEICNGGSTSLIRPPASYTTKLKEQQFTEYTYQGEFNGKPVNTSDFEEDHLISLELGGAPKSPLNLWPEPWNGNFGAHAKDKVENETHKLVCTGKMSVTDAQTKIAKDWVALGREEGVIK